MTVDTRPIVMAAVAVDTDSAAMVAVPVGIGMMLLALAVEGLAARRAVGTRVWRNFLGTLLLLAIPLAGHVAQMAAWAAAS